MAELVRILHVDDDPDFAELTAISLENDNEQFTVETATSASEALEKLSNQDFDCIISDYEMPQQDGLDLLAIVRDRYGNLPFVLFTGKGGEEIASEAISMGVTDYLQKRSTSEQYDLLANRIHNAVQRMDHRNKIRKLHNVAMTFASLDTIQDVCDNTVEAARNLLAFTSGSVSLYDPAENRFETKTAENTVFDLPHSIPANGSLAGETLREQQTVIVDDINDSETVLEEYAPQSAMSTPIGEYGVLQVGSTEAADFDTDDVELIELLASHAAEAIDRIKRQQEIQHQRDRAEVLFEMLPEPTVLLQSEETARIEDVNPAFEDVFGYEANKIRGEVLNDLIVPEEHHEEAEQIDKDALEGDNVTKEVVRMTADGECRDFLLIGTGRVIHTDKDIPEGYAIYVDITERKAVERELQRQNDRLEDFASVISHDLQNPLKVANGYLELAQEECNSEHLDSIDRAHDRMQTLIDDLLALARQGERVSDFEPVDLAKIAEQSWHNIETKDAQIKIETQQTIQADRVRLKQLLENLFQNAVKHGGHDVRVSVKESASETGFVIEDTGVGIPVDERDRIFNHGYSTAEDGTGFGLPIVKEIVEAHGWEIDVSDSSGGGAQFTVSGIDVTAEET